MAKSTLFGSLFLIFAIFDNTMASQTMLFSGHKNNVKAAQYGNVGKSNAPTKRNNPFDSPQGKACSFYIWNAPAAGIYAICQFLQKDCTYEGRGGRKFIYIRPGSLLQLLHPHCPRSKNICLICGGTYRDHLTLAWAKHHYRPFDMHIDRIFRNGYRINESAPAESSVRIGKRKTRNAQSLPRRNTIELAFHQRYVQDVTDRVKTLTTQKEQIEMLKEATDGTSFDSFEMVTLLPSKKSYIVPIQEGPTVQNIMFRFVRLVVLERLNALIHIEHLEEEELNRRVNPKKFI